METIIILSLSTVTAVIFWLFNNRSLILSIMLEAGMYLFKPLDVPIQMLPFLSSASEVIKLLLKELLSPCLFFSNAKLGFLLINFEIPDR